MFDVAHSAISVEPPADSIFGTTSDRKYFISSTGHGLISENFSEEEFLRHSAKNATSSIDAYRMHIPCREATKDVKPVFRLIDRSWIQIP